MEEMKVKQLIAKLQKEDPEKEVVIVFALDKNDDIGYTLKPFETHYSEWQKKVWIIVDEDWHQEDYDWVGQANLQKLWRDWYNDENVPKEEIKEKIISLQKELSNLNKKGGDVNRIKALNERIMAYEDLL